ncbi:MAG: carboxypeptidase-like regulatory domain-containing protein, partial [Dysgonamonadaceae bacterium]|nr:carboxypeptidase-like regulatory domain-containing protein [Dysgonamonadaceae bacterium]
MKQHLKNPVYQELMKFWAVLVLLFLLSTQSIYSQQAFSVSGNVTEASGEALAGVSVVVKNTKTGTV